MLFSSPYASYTPVYNATVNSRAAYCYLALQTRDLEVQSPILAENWRALGYFKIRIVKLPANPLSGRGHNIWQRLKPTLTQDYV